MLICNVATKELIGVTESYRLFTKPWYKKFKNLEDFHKQPWLDRILVWFEQHSEKYTHFLSLSEEERERVFLILAAGFWAQDKRIDIGGLSAVKIAEPPGTGFIKSNDPDSIIIVERTELPGC